MKKNIKFNFTTQNFVLTGGGKGIDIDELEDFYFAEYIFKNKKKYLETIRK